MADPRDARFERDVLACLPALARFARSLTGDAADADDLAQETCLLAYRGYHTFRAGDDPRRWLFTICRHAFLRQHRRDAAFVELDELGDPASETLAAVYAHVAAQRDGAAARLETMDLGPAVEQAIAALPVVFRLAVLLVDVEGQTYDEAAVALGVPIGTVRSRLYRARRLLQERLFDHARDAGFRLPAPTRAVHHPPEHTDVIHA